MTTNNARVTPNIFGIPLAFCGLAQCWSTALATTSIPRWPADLVWIVAACVWVACLIWYGLDVDHGRRWRTELKDPTFAPFTALVVIVPMLLGVALAGHARSAGVMVFGVALVLTLAIGAWLTGDWIISGQPLSQWHHGYFLPTVAGGLIAAGGSAALGFHTLFYVMFGYGMISWFAIESIVLVRLFTAPPLPPRLRPTLAIELAPAAVSANAWFLANGGRVDAGVAALTGYGLLVALVQLRLVPFYRTVPFGPSWWAFGFSYAAAFTLGIDWLAAERVPGHTAWVIALLCLITTAVLALAIPTLRRLVRGSFLPVPEHPSPGPGPSPVVRQARSG